MRPVVQCFGDSITQRGFEVAANGWLAQLADYFSRRAHVVNQGYSGYNTRWGCTMLDGLFKQERNPVGTGETILVTIFFGANDAQLAPGRQHVPVEEYGKNLECMVRHIQACYPKAAVVLMSPPPLHDGMWKHGAQPGKAPDREGKVTATYAERCRKVADACKVHFLDVFTVLGGMDQDSIRPHVSDGLHLSAKGNALLFTCLVAFLELQIPEITPERLKPEAPLHGDVDPECYHHIANQL
ncbi:unnamed protein product [Chrysoparadoxa australica]